MKCSKGAYDPSGYDQQQYQQQQDDEEYGVSVPALHQRPQGNKDEYAVSRGVYTPYSSYGIARPKIDDKDHFELKGQFLKELRDNTFSRPDHEDANEHIEKVLDIVDLFYIANINQDQVMLRAFPMSLTGATSHWLRNKTSGSIITWEDLKTKFLSKYCPSARTAKKIEEINNFQQEPDETLYQAWERFKELLIKCPQPIQAQLNNLGREIKKVNEKVYAAQVECEQCKGPYYTKDFPLKEEGKTLEEAYYTQFGRPFQRGGYRAAAPSFYQRNNANPSLIKRVYMLSLREKMELDLEARLMGETLVLNRSLDPLYGDYIELNDLIVPLELRRDQVDDLIPTIKEVENMDGYRDQDMGDIILGEPFRKASYVDARRFDGVIIIHNDSDNVTYQMAQSHPRFKHLSDAQ
ncbi:homeodomain-like protein [Tanacetum coccineum]